MSRKLRRFLTLISIGAKKAMTRHQQRTSKRNLRKWGADVGILTSYVRSSATAAPLRDDNRDDALCMYGDSDVAALLIDDEIDEWMDVDADIYIFAFV